MDFTLTDEQKDLRELAHNFAEKEIRKVAWEYDKDGTWPQEIIDKAWEVGLMNTHVPEEYGGPGLDFLSGCLIEEEFGWGCSGIGTSLAANGLAMTPVGARRHRRDQGQRYLGMLAEEPKLASFCLTEPDAGSDVSGMKTTAKSVATSGSSTAPSASSPTASTPTGTRSTRRPTRTPATAASPPSSSPATTPSSSTRRRTRWASGRRTRPPSPSTRPRFPADHLLGEENKGFKLAMMTLDRTRPGVAAMAVGIGRAAFEFAAEYSKERVQFGVPIAMHQAVAFMIADMATKVEAGRLLTWQSAALIDQGIRNTLACSHAKRFAADSAMEITPMPCRSTAATASSRSTRSRS